tara:strand:+ start:1263 stop:1625 length:363 start_codon:yes stop_codon:yes gene_type:complete
MKQKFKVGDKVECITNSNSDRVPGAGWELDKQFVIGSAGMVMMIEPCYFPVTKGLPGVYESHLRLVRTSKRKADYTDKIKYWTKQYGIAFKSNNTVALASSLESLTHFTNKHIQVLNKEI